jgi:hypothetical protein
MYIIKVIIPMLAILLASIFGCAIGNPSNQYAATKKIQSGWIKSDQLEKKVSDTFYFKVSSYTGSSVISGAKKEFVCKQGALEIGRESLADKIVEDLSIDSNKLATLSEINNTVKDLRVKECRPTAISDPNIPFSEWNSCECMIIAKVDGGKSNLLAKTF